MELSKSSPEGSVGALGRILAALESSLALLLGSWRAPGACLEASWCVLEPSWGRLGGSWGHLGSQLGAKRVPKGCPRGLEMGLRVESCETLFFDDSSMNFNDFGGPGVSFWSPNCYKICFGSSWKHLGAILGLLEAS